MENERKMHKSESFSTEEEYGAAAVEIYEELFGLAQPFIKYSAPFASGIRNELEHSIALTGNELRKAVLDAQTVWSTSIHSKDVDAKRHEIRRQVASQMQQRAAAILNNLVEDGKPPEGVSPGHQSEREIKTAAAHFMKELQAILLNDGYGDSIKIKTVRL
jgi:hypothetical protein